MKKFEGYESARVNGDYEKIELGPHICKILEVKVEEITTKEGRTFEQLILKIDMDSKDKQPGYYSKKFQSDATTNALNAKWKGYYKLSIPEDGSEDYIKANFKTLITSVEQSNPGYVWNWEENTLVGKKFCGVFGIEEFKNDKGDVIAFTRCRYIRSTENMDKIEIPKVILADKTKIDYEEYMNNKAQKKDNNTSTTTEEVATLDSDDLPF